MARIEAREYNQAQQNNIEKINGDYFLKIIPADGDGNFIGPETPLATEPIKYNTNDIEEASATITYIGLQDKNGNWYVKKIDTSSGNSFGHATIINNVSYTTYTTAWAARASLVYGDYGDVF